MTKKKSTETNTERLLGYLKENALNGVYRGSFTRIAKAIGMKNPTSASYAMNKLVEQGKVKVLKKGQRGLNVAEYQILDEKTFSSSLDFEAEILVEWRGIKLKLVYVDDHGYCLSKEDLARIFVTDSLVGLEDYERLIDLKVERNLEQFTHHIAILDGKQYFDRIAVMLYLNKIDLADSSDNKRSQLNQLQLTLAEKMVDVVLRGKVDICEKDRICITSNIANILDLNVEQVTDLLSDIEKQVQALYSEKTREVARLKKENDKQSFLIKSYKDKEKSFISEIAQLKQERMDYITN